MSKGAHTGAWAPSKANHTLFARARSATARTGKSWPVVQLTWLKMMSRVLAVTSRPIRLTLPMALAASGSNSRTTMPSRFMRWRSAE